MPVTWPQDAWPYDQPVPRRLTQGYCRCARDHGPSGHHRHARPPLHRRAARAICRGMARALAVPLWPEHKLYVLLSPGAAR
jgi:hypothetical protein